MLDTIGLLLFFSNYRKNANLHLDLRVRPRAEKALVNISEIQEIHKEIAKQIKARNDRIAIYSRKKHENRS